VVIENLMFNKSVHKAGKALLKIHLYQKLANHTISLTPSFRSSHNTDDTSSPNVIPLSHLCAYPASPQAIQ